MSRLNVLDSISEVGMLAEPSSPADLLTPEEAAVLLRISGATIRRWIKIGTLPAFKIGTRLRIAKADVLAMLKPVPPEDATPPSKVNLNGESDWVEKVLAKAKIRKFRFTCPTAEELSHAPAPRSILDSKNLPVTQRRAMTVRELVATWYVTDPRGWQDGEVIRTIRACEPMLRLFGLINVREFNASHLEMLQYAMLTTEWMTPEEREQNGDWSRGYINANLDRVRRLFRWAEAKGHANPGTWQHLKSVMPIKRNDRRVRNTPPRKPCDWDKQVIPAMAKMYPQVRAMVLVQFYGGMRPGEAVSMRRSEIDLNGPQGTWVYRPGKHKGSYWGQELAKVLGPKAQEALSPWLLEARFDGFVFPAVLDRWNRGHFTVEGFCRAVSDACEKANVERFTPYQLRHLCRLRVTRAFSLDHARAVLGHTSLGMSAEYAKGIDIETAAEVAVAVG